VTLKVPAPFRIQHLHETDSTNRVAMDAARAGAAGGLVVVADRQHAGKGRQGRTWTDDGERSLLVSFLLRPAVPLRLAWGFTFVAGLAALHAAEVGGAHDAWLKWPNDLWVSDRKAGGVLCELASSKGRLDGVVLGIGLNLLPPVGGWPEEIEGRAAALGSDAPYLVSRAHALSLVCEGLLHWEDQLARFGVRPLIRAVEHAMRPMVGRTVQAEIRGALTPATVLGIGQNGALRLVTTDGRSLELLAGDVHLRPAQSTQGS